MTERSEPMNAGPGRAPTAAEREGIISALRAGAVPSRGLHHIQVGRAREVEAILATLDAVCEGGSALRLVVGDYGSGKTFALSLTRSAALAKGLAVARVDLTPSLRLHGTDGQARALFQAVVAGLGTPGRAEGALEATLQRLVGVALSEAALGGPGPEPSIRGRLARLTDLPGGFDYAAVVERYIRGHDTGDDDLKQHAVRWLRGELTSKRDARALLGVRSVVEDANWVDHLRLLARLVRLAGHRGLLVLVDEAASLQRIQNPQARTRNYEQLLAIWNACFQGGFEGLGLVFAITREALLHPRTGLYSHDALRSRIAENPFATAGLVDRSGPVLHLAPLEREELYVLLRKVRRVFARGEDGTGLLPDVGVSAFIQAFERRLGPAAYRSPRDTVQAFCDLLAALEQNRGASWRDVLAGAGDAAEVSSFGRQDDDDDLAAFRI